MRYKMAAFLVVVAVGATPIAQDGPPRIEPQDAATFRGKVVTACGRVDGVTCNKGASTLLTLAAFSDKHVTIVAPDSLRSASTIPPEQRFDMQRVCATGLVSRGSTGEEIRVDDLSRIWVEENITPPFATHAHWACEDGITMPILLREVKPPYTVEAMKRRVEGRVGMQAVVEADGRVGAVRITRSLDTELDMQAMTAMKGWQFRPARFDGQPAAVVVVVDMTFTMRK